MSILSKACVYGIRAALYVSAQPKDREFVPIREIADELKISFHFLTKILQLLTEGGLMHSYRGPHGGVSLTKSPKDIRVRSIVETIDGGGVFNDCILGLEGCGELKPCPLHHVWVKERKRLEALFADTTLADLAVGFGLGKLRLSDG